MREKFGEVKPRPPIEVKPPPSTIKERDAQRKIEAEKKAKEAAEKALEKGGDYYDTYWNTYWEHYYSEEWARVIKKPKGLD